MPPLLTTSAPLLVLLALPSLAAACAQSAAPPPATAAAPPATPACTETTIQAGGQPVGVDVTCRAAASVAVPGLREAAHRRAAVVALSARRTHVVPGPERLTSTPPLKHCPELPPDDRRHNRQLWADLTGGSVSAQDKRPPCTAVAGTEGRLLEVSFRFVDAPVTGAESAVQVLGLTQDAGVPHPHPDGGDAGRDSGEVG